MELDHGDNQARSIEAASISYESIEVESIEDLVALLADFTNDRRGMSADEIKRWAGMYRNFLMTEQGAQLEEVVEAARRSLGDSSFFPTIAMLSPIVEEIVAKRLKREAMIRSQREAVPAKALPRSETPDYSNTPTRDLPVGYDYASDDHWLKAMMIIDGVFEGREPTLPIAKAAKDLRRKMENRESLGFHGAPAAGPRCPTCGSRGVDEQPVRFVKDPASGEPIPCPTCCPNGRYDFHAERAAIRKAATR